METKEKRPSGKKTGGSYKGTKKTSGEKKPFGEKRSFGEKKQFSDKKSFGDRKPYGERKSSGEHRDHTEKKPFTGRKPFGDKKPFARKPYGERKLFESKESRPEDWLDERLEIALQTLIDIEKNGKYINLAFKHNDKLDRLEKKDRAYVMRILYGVTEKSYTIDWLLSKVLNDKRVKPWLSAILRIGTYQIYYMRIEDGESIRLCSLLCKKYVSEELCSFVKAVLCKLSEHKDEYNPELYKFRSTNERISVIYSYPLWLVDMWTKDYSEETVSSLLEKAPERAINLRVSSASAREQVIAELTEKEIECSEGILYNTVSVSDTVNIESLESYKNGLVTAQGIGSMITVDCLDVKRDSKVLDVCAAPGGKSFYIAAKTTETVEACDVHEHRVELINKGCERLHLENVHTTCRDMTEFVPEYKNAFDRVLVDAPCSGLGMINSKPDIKNNITEEAIDELAGIQAKILDNASEYVKEGGLLVFSTCTVSKKENNENVRKFLEAHTDFELADIREKIPENVNYVLEDGTVLILPSMYNSDAFFISAMRRK